MASYNAIHETNFTPTDITKIHGEDLGIVETDRFTYLLTYSFPCQDLSIAGKQKGMSKGDNTRSGLLWEVERLLNEVDNLPQLLLMENVPQVHGKKNIVDFEKWISFLESKGYSNFWQDLNAKDYGIAQNRNRCFMVSILGDYCYSFPKPLKSDKVMEDYLEDTVDEKYYVNGDKVSTLLNNLYSDDLPKSRETVKLKGMSSSKYEPSATPIDIACTLCARDYKGLNNFGMNGVIECQTDVFCNMSEANMGKK